MTLAFHRLSIVPVLAAAASSARADGELAMRGIYYKERATRVEQPMLDARFDAREEGVAVAHMLVDAITSASVAAGNAGTSFTERRYEGGGGYTDRLGRFQVGGQARYSTEPDYRSVFGGVHADVELLDKNLTLGAAASYGHDDASNAGAPPMVPRIYGVLNTYLGSVSLSQILGPNVLGAITYDVSHLDGLQSNLYRTVIVAGTLVRERHPSVRTRHATATSLRWFVPRSSTTAIMAVRYYRDTWGAEAWTPELRVVQDVDDAGTVAFRYRFHRQTKADFYDTRYESTTLPFLSDDVKLSAFDSHTLGAELQVVGETFGFAGRLATTRGAIGIDYVAQDNRFGNAIVAQVALTVPFEY